MSLDSRPSEFKNRRSPGPYEAIVVSHLDPRNMGTLEVELLKHTTSGNQAERTGQIVKVKYLSPFYSVTPVSASSDNDDFNSTQKAAGMWFVPPDVGTIVLVLFIEGNLGRGYWFGCAQDTYMNFTVPDPWVASTLNNQDTGKKLPVGEYNKKTQKSARNAPTKYTKPVRDDFLKKLIEQGLDEDEVRGYSSSSARREVPSGVFGISTPGPVDKRKSAPKAPVGPKEVKTRVFASRLGGSSMVFDDGDDKYLRKGPAADSPSEYADLRAGETGGDVTIPMNELVRIRTRTGHQILLHNSEDLIYIANAAGTSWIELTSNGKIDIYAQDSISVHSAQDLNFTADRDINLSAGENFNLVVGNESRTDVGSSYSLTTGDFIASNAGGNITSNSAGYISNYAELTMTNISREDMCMLSAARMNIESKDIMGIEAQDGDIRMYTGANFQLKAVENTRITTEGNLDTDTTGKTRITSGSSSHINSGGNHIETAPQIHMNGPAAESAELAEYPETPAPEPAVDPVRAAHTARIPQHEPWYEHESNDPESYKPDKTRAGLEQIQSFRPPQSDTFKKTDQPPGIRTVETSEKAGLYELGTESITEIETLNAANQALGSTVDGFVYVPRTILRNPSVSPPVEDTETLNDSLASTRMTGADYGDISGESDPGFGFYGAPGGGSVAGNYVQYQAPESPLPQGQGFLELNSLLEGTLESDWKERGKPGNSLILTAYSACGFEFEDDKTPWCAAFVSWALIDTGIAALKTLSSQAYASYAQEINWRTWENVRANDIVVFKSRTRSGGHVGFFRGYNPSTGRVAILGGNQSDTVKISNFKVNGNLYVKTVRRNWLVPEKFDFPIIDTKLATGPLEDYSSTR